MVHLRRKFLVFSFLSLLTPGVEPDETVFKGVPFVHITLSLAGPLLLHGVVPREWSGRYTSLLLCILFVRLFYDRSQISLRPFLTRGQPGTGLH